MSVIRCWSCILVFLALVNKQSFKVNGGKWTMDGYIGTTSAFLLSSTNKALEIKQRVN